jgi:hypothetical protein
MYYTNYCSRVEAFFQLRHCEYTGGIRNKYRVRKYFLIDRDCSKRSCCYFYTREIKTNVHFTAQGW